jgi:hypothetical protein
MVAPACENRTSLLPPRQIALDTDAPGHDLRLAERRILNLGSRHLCSYSRHPELPAGRFRLPAESFIRDCAYGLPGPAFHQFR